MGNLAELLTDESRTEPYLRNVVRMVQALVNPAYAHTDLVRIEGHLFVVVGNGPYTYRFGVPPDERMWVAEYRNELCDPPGVWDHHGDGPLASAEQQVVANWIAEVAAPDLESVDA